jgi:hypothetical protein
VLSVPTRAGRPAISGASGDRREAGELGVALIAALIAARHPQKNTDRAARLAIA